MVLGVFHCVEFVFHEMLPVPYKIEFFRRKVERIRRNEGIDEVSVLP